MVRRRRCCWRRVRSSCFPSYVSSFCPLLHRELHPIHPQFSPDPVRGLFFLFFFCFALFVPLVFSADGALFSGARRKKYPNQTPLSLKYPLATFTTDSSGPCWPSVSIGGIPCASGRLDSFWESCDAFSQCLEAQKDNKYFVFLGRIQAHRLCDFAATR